MVNFELRKDDLHQEILMFNPVALVTIFKHFTVCNLINN